MLLGLGWGLVIVGLVGGLLPVIQGWPFGVAGAAILYVESRTVQRQVRHWRRKHPRFERAWARARKFLKGKKKRPNAPQQS